MPKKNLANERVIKSLATKLEREDFYDTSWSAKGGFGVRVSSRGKKSFFVFYTQEGKRRRFTLEPCFPVLGLADARDKALALIGKVVEGEDPSAEKARLRGAQRVSELFDDFMIQKGSTYARSTYTNYYAMYRKDCEQVIGDMRCESVQKGHIIKILDNIEARTVGPHQVNRTRTMLLSLFNWATSKDRCDNNPVLAVPKAQAKEMPGERFLDTKEIKLYWQCAEEMSTVDRVYFRLLMLLALRPGEAKKLQWSWIDGAVLTIPASEVKNRREHKLYLSKAARAEIELLSKDSPFLFPGLTGKGARRFFERSHKELMQAMGVPYWTPRDIRRTCETQMRTFIRDSEGISRVLNHDVSAIRRHYDHGDYFRRKKEVLMSWSQWIDELINGRQTVVNLDAYR